MTPHDTRPRDETFSDYYVMMLSVLHGLVLGTAAYGLSVLAIPALDSSPLDTFWIALRWLVSFLFEVFTAWKYIVGAAKLRWELNPLDVAVPSLLGIAIAASFITIQTATGWLLMMITTNFFGLLAGLYALYKTKRSEFAGSKEYRRVLYFNIAGGLGVMALGTLWLLLHRQSVTWSAVVLLLPALFMLLREFKLKRKP